MKLSYSTGSQILGVALLAGIWSVACSSNNDNSGAGGSAPATGGTTAAANTSAGAKATGGSSAKATGGAPAGTGGAPAGTGGAPAGTGGAATGGAPAGTGGAATGGVPAGTGGSSATSTNATGGTTVTSTNATGGTTVTSTNATGGTTVTSTSATGGTTVTSTNATGGTTSTSTSTSATGGTTSTSTDATGGTTNAGGTTSTSTAAAAVQYIVNSASTTATAGAQYGQTSVSSASVPVTAGDWIIISSTIAYTNIGQTYAQLFFTPTSTGTAAYPSLGQIYQTTTTNSVAYYQAYIVPEAGTISGIVFNNNAYDSTATTPAMTALPSGTTVTYTNLKVARIAAADLATTAPALVNTATATMVYYQDTSGTTPADNLQYAPTGVNVSAAAGTTLVATYTRPAITTAYTAHYLNSGLASWGAVYPDKVAGTIFIYEPITAAATTNWLQLGIQGQSPAATDTLAITNVQVRVIPAL